MEMVNLHDAKTRLSKLVDQAARGEPFIIAKSGRPVAKVMAIEAPGPDETRRLGFLAGEIEVPDDFDRMGEEHIARLFGTGDDSAA